MSILPKRDPFVLLVGDIVIFALSLWLTLIFRNLEMPTWELLVQHLVPFSILFLVWVFVFLLAGLYDRSTRLLRGHLSESILYSQTVNVALAALFFFFVPQFGITPKVILAIYLVVSSVLVFFWRVYIFPAVTSHARQNAILIGAGADVEELLREVNSNPHYPFVFAQVIDTNDASLSEAVQKLCRVIAEKSPDSIIVADTSAPMMNAVLPIVYDVAFNAQHFVFLDVNDLYQEVFERVSISSMKYGWILSNIGRSLTYDVAKRVIDIWLGIFGCILLAVIYPLVALAIKLDDGGEVLAPMQRIGRYGHTFEMLKFRSMSGNDHGIYKNGKSNLTVTRVGKFLRKTHIDEFPQFINLLRGDLSFVGPRPEVPALAAQYAALIPFYNARHLIQPGLTGWARLRHKHDPHHGTDVEQTKMKLTYDLYYLKHRSFVLDTNIIVQTVKFILGAKGA